MRILMVDEEPCLPEDGLISFDLDRSDFDIKTCRSAEKALDLLKDEEFDAIVSEFEIPGMNGLEFLEEVRGKRDIDIPFIIFTGNESVVVDALNLGADRFIEKTGSLNTQYYLLSDAIYKEVLRHREENSLRRLKDEKSKILDSAAEHIIYHGKDLEVLYANRAAADSVGAQPEDLIGRKCYKIWGDEEKPCSDCPVTLAFEHGRKFTREVRSPDGRYWLITGSPVIDVTVGTTPHKDYDGEIIGTVGFVQDITDRKKAEEKLHQNEQFLEFILEAIRDGISVLDKDLRIQYANPIMREWYSENTPLEGKKCYECYQNSEEPCDPCPTIRSLKNGTVEKDVVKGLSGTDIEWLELYSYPMRDSETGEITGVVELLTDVTERKKMENAIIESKERLDLAMAVTNEGIWDWDLTSDKVYYDPRYYQMAGYDINAFPHRLEEFKNRVHRDDVEKVFTQAKKHINGEIERFDVEFRFKKSDGEYMWVKGRGRIVERDEDGKPIRFVGTHADITDKKKAEEELKKYQNNLEELVDKKTRELSESEEYKRSILELIPDIMIKTNREGQYLEIISKSEDELIQPKEKTIGKKITDLFPEEEAVRVMEHLRKSIDDDVLQKVEYEIPIKGQKKWFEARIVPSGEGEAFALIRNITERKKTEMILKEKNEELESFAYSVSHDLRAPLRAIQGFGSILLEDNHDSISEDKKVLIRRMNNAAERMDVLMQDLLHYSRLSALEVELQHCDLGKALERVLDELENEIDREKAEVNIEEPLHPVIATRTLLNQIICNLISNAIKFVSDDQTPIVTVWTEEKDDNVKIKVKDNGIGIDRDDQEMIFNMFDRLHGIESYKGTGVGLAIVKKAVDKLGGKFGVESVPGEGSTFWIELKKSG